MANHEKAIQQSIDNLTQTLSSAGEINDWIEGDIIGDTPLAATYVLSLKAFYNTLKNDETLAADLSPTELEARKKMHEASLILAGVLARESQARSRNTPQMEGIAPVHTVSEADIQSVAARFDKDDPAYKGYQDSDVIAAAHDFIMQTAIDAALQYPSDEQK
jgi:hypothetical protein